MFSDKYGITLSVLNKVKTQTRRIVPKSVLQKADEYRVEYYNGTLDSISLIEAVRQLYFVDKRLSLPYEVGETVAIAQKYRDLISKGNGGKETLEHYKIGDKFLTKDDIGDGFYNKMFVSAHLMQNHIAIKGCRVEYLQDISEEDCMKEGIYFHKIPDTNHKYDRYSPWSPSVKPYKFSIDNEKYFCSARFAYAHLIDKISGGGTWDSNPIVMVYDFELIE